MYYIILCTDKPNSGQIRLDARPAHIEFIKAAGDKIKLGGATVTDDDQTMTGSFLMVEGESLAEVEAWAAQDPFKQAGLFADVVVRPWRYVMGDGPTK